MSNKTPMTFSNIASRQHESAIANCLAHGRLRILQMMTDKQQEGEFCTLDVGCGWGLFSYILSKRGTTIGVDIQKSFAKNLSNSDKSPNFVVADINALPFKSQSFDMIVCASVLEHLINIEACILELRDLLKKNGTLIAAYPVETRLFKLVWRIVSPREFKFIDLTQVYFVNPYTHNRECYWKNPTTHKQTYKTIRKLLKKYFRVAQSAKLPFNSSPDFITFYEYLSLIR